MTTIIVGGGIEFTQLCIRRILGGITMSNYETLVRILDQIRNEAPSQYRSYYPVEDDTEKVNQARSKAFIHLFLKVRFGLLDFLEREKWVTDDIDDGGVDGYFIDEETKIICLIQSKFRTNEMNFKDKEIELQEILKMDADRIVKGETSYENGNKYNGKIQILLRKIQSISDIALYKYQVIILANLTNITQPQLNKLVGGLPSEVFNFERCYRQLVFPVVTGTYFSATDVFVYLNLTNKSAGSRIRYNVTTEFRECEITVVFVPTIEIAKLMHKYKNSVLKYNPRSYLDLSDNPVNSQISKSIRDRSSNEFALFNNGITVLSDKTFLTEQTGQKNRAQLKLTNPQIINGGQTAYTLSKIYEDEIKGENPEKCFEDKEVLVKVITFLDDEDDSSNGDLATRLSLIEAISKATNLQTDVTDADRRSNDKTQVQIQERIFDEYGQFYERKRGEYWNGSRDGYIDQRRIIDRGIFLRVCLACSGLAAQARRNSERVLFSSNEYYSKLCDLDRIDKHYFGYICLDVLNQTQKRFDRVPHNRFGVINYGNALRYGKMAVVAVASKSYKSEMKKEDYQQEAEKIVDDCLNKWLAFEDHISKLKHNEDYFRAYADIASGGIRYEVNYDNYYKGRTLNSDLKSYFGA